MLRTHTSFPANFKNIWATLLLNLQMLYLILGNFCNTWNDFPQPEPTPWNVFFFFFVIFVLFFLLPKPQVVQKIVIDLCILLCYEPLHLSETYGLLTYGLCLYIDSVLNGLGKKRVTNHGIFDNTPCSFRIYWWGTEGNWLYSKLRKHFNSIFKTVQKERRKLQERLF